MKASSCYLPWKPLDASVLWLEELLPDEIADCRALRRRDPIQQLQARLCTVITKFAQD